MSDDLQFGEIEILEDDFCMKSYDFNTYSNDKMICAGYENVSIVGDFLKKKVSKLHLFFKITYYFH